MQDRESLIPLFKEYKNNEHGILQKIFTEKGWLQD